MWRSKQSDGAVDLQPSVDDVYPCLQGYIIAAALKCCALHKRLLCELM